MTVQLLLNLDMGTLYHIWTTTILRRSLYPLCRPQPLWTIFIMLPYHPQILRSSGIHRIDVVCDSCGPYVLAPNCFTS